MNGLAFTVLGAAAEPYTAAPALTFRVRIEDGLRRHVHAATVRCQIQIEPQRRHYTGTEQQDLYELFDVPRRWGETLKPLQWAHVSVAVPGFGGETEIDLPVACTYDFDVAATKYFQALDGGEVPLLFLWSGTVFLRTDTGFAVEPVSWDRESTFRLPVAVWRQAIDFHFPGTAWLRLRRDHVESLYRFKARRGLPTWDDAVAALLAAAGEEVAG